jgi:hypothetical protein
MMRAARFSLPAPWAPLMRNACAKRFRPRAEEINSNARSAKYAMRRHARWIAPRGNPKTSPATIHPKPAKWLLADGPEP